MHDRWQAHLRFTAIIYSTLRYNSARHLGSSEHRARANASNNVISTHSEHQLVALQVAARAVSLPIASGMPHAGRMLRRWRWQWHGAGCTLGLTTETE